MSLSVRCAIYARISSDTEGLALGVKRQTDDCTAEAERRGWTVAGTYIDNDVSATRSKRRPEYERLMADIGAGMLAGLIVWDVDRLTRTPRELEDIIDLADRRGLALASIGGEIDLATPQGRMTARIKGSVARHETEQQSRRLKRKFLERAEAGRPHSFVAYGYRRVNEFDEYGNRINTRDELDPVQVTVIRLAADLLLAGQSLRSVAAELNRQGATSARGLPWNSTTLKQIMVRERNSGRRVHQGQVVGDGQWPAVYDRGVHDRVIALLTDPGRRTSKGATRRHLLSSLARCGRGGCDGTMVVNVGRVQANGSRQPPAYVCGRCTKVRRKQAAVDDLVGRVIIGRLGQPDVLGVLAVGDPVEMERARIEVAALEARLDLAADEYADGALTGAQLRRITERLRPKIDTARAQISANMAAPWVAQSAGPDAELRWLAASLDTRRALIEMLCTVKIMPVGSGRGFDPSAIAIEWKGSDR